MSDGFKATGHSTKYGYDAARRLTKLEQLRLIDDAVAGVQQPEYQVTTYEYDANGKVIAVETPLGGVEKYSYNGAGHVTSKLDGDGLETRYAYTRTGQLEQISYADGKTVEFGYNPLKQLTRVHDWLGETQITLDPLGRATEVRDYAGKTVGYAWDAAGRREKTTYPDGKEVRYSYTAAGQIETVHAPAGETRYLYDPAGRLKERHLPDRVRSIYNFDPLGRITELTHRNDMDVLDQFRYTYDPVGNITQIKKNRKGLEADSGLFQYAYDPLGRLTSVTHGKDVQAFRYDALGNRVQSQQGSETPTHYSYNAANQLVQTQTGSQVQDYRYDGRGNLTEILENNELRQIFSFDATNRMVNAITAGVGQAAYTYDGLLNRVKKLEGGQETRYVLDRTLPYDNLLMTEGAQSQSFTWGNELIAADDMLYLQDHLGSPIRLIHNWQTPLAYDAFGAMTTGMTPNVRQPFGFTGYEVEATTGQYYAQARYYNPQQGRFAAEDTARDGTNWYAYCHANPLRFVDKDGLTALTPDLILDTRGSDWIGAGEAMPAWSPNPMRDLNLPMGYDPFSSANWAPPGYVPTLPANLPPSIDHGPLYDRYNGGGFEGHMTGNVVDAWNGWNNLQDAASERFPVTAAIMRTATGAVRIVFSVPVVFGGAALSATGAGAPVGTPAMAWGMYRFGRGVYDFGGGLLDLGRALSDADFSGATSCSDDRAQWFDDYGFVHPFVP